MTITTPYSTRSLRLIVRESEAFKVSAGEADEKLPASVLATSAAASTVKLEGSVHCAD